MTIIKYLSASLVATTVLGGAAFATEHATHSAASQEAAAQRAVDRDVGKFSKDGALAFRELHLARVAIFDAQPVQAKELIGKVKAELAKAELAKAELAKAKTDDAVFNRAEAELSEKADLNAKKADKTAEKKDSAGSNKIAWLPIDARLTLDEDFQATPAKSAADVDRAAALIDQGKYYEANAVLKTAEDRMRFDIVDTVGLPQ